ncbi:hypothetical protein NIES4074_03820 [Cylindrospermum sp. NIES-4074]|nr:hypothetical protein NIES4074_03820 [Cylindrospermum sp. NIES-4074]
MKSLESIWLALSIVLTTATQLRPESLPVGIGEVMLVVWMIYIILRILTSGQNIITPIVRVVCLFWLVSSISLSLGNLIASSMNVVSRTVGYDTLALVFACIFSVLLTLSLPYEEHLNKIVVLAISFTIISLMVMLLFPGLIPFVNPWYGGIRFAGWAKNPNQIALLLSMMPFLLLHLLNHERHNQLTRNWYILLMFGISILGFSTNSDALKVAWIVGILILSLLKFNQFISNYISKSQQLYQAFIYSLLFRTLMLLATVGTLYFYHHQQEELYVNEAYNEDSQESVRFTLWIHGIMAISSSPVFGLGPGVYSGMTGPLLNFEAHNTFIDWTTCSGAIGLISYVSLLGWIAWNAWKNNSIILFTAIISIAGFSSFHYVLRHPIFWFYLLTIARWSVLPLKHRDERGNSNAQTLQDLRNWHISRVRQTR